MADRIELVAVAGALDRALQTLAELEIEDLEAQRQGAVELFGVGGEPNLVAALAQDPAGHQVGAAGKDLWPCRRAQGVASSRR